MHVSKELLKRSLKGHGDNGKEEVKEVWLEYIWFGGLVWIKPGEE